MKTLLLALLAGLLFGLGLAISGMTNADKVQNFLDLSGTWDPSLLFVMGAAIFVGTPGFWQIQKLKTTLINTSFQIPSNKQLDWRLLVGSASFGIGWGLAGYCPGPAIAGIGLANMDAIYFLPALGLGFILAGLLPKTSND